MNAKQEIIRLINHSAGYIYLSQYTILEWNIKRRPGLRVYFTMKATITNKEADVISYDIKSRDYDSIIREIQEAQTRAYAQTADFLNDELARGYIRG